MTEIHAKKRPSAQHSGTKTQGLDLAGGRASPEREGRVIDHDQSASMEKKKQEGYF